MRHETISLPSGDIHALTWGDTGPLTLLVHGLDGSAANWIDVAPALAERQRVVAIDLPGFGRTPLEGRRTSMAAFAGVVAEAITALDGRATVMGNSMGAVVALHAAGDAPELVERVVLAAPAVPRSGHLPYDPSMIPWVLPYAVPGLMRVEPLRRARKDPSRRVRWLLDLCYARGRGNRESAEAFAEMVDVAAQRDAGDHARAWVGSSRSLFWGLTSRRAWHRMADRVTAPVLVVAGAVDPVLPKRSIPALIERHPTWALASLADVGHVPQLEEPDAFLRVVAPRAALSGTPQAPPTS